MAYTYNTGRDVLALLGVCLGPIMLFMGFLLHILIGPIAGIGFQWTFLAIVLIGVGLFVAGLGLLPGTRRRAKLWKAVLEIAAVEKEVTILDISQRTGIDSEMVRKILVHCLMNHMLFGYIDGDLFVRDTSARPFRYMGPTGLFSE
jgi:MFS family permease